MSTKHARCEVCGELFFYRGKTATRCLSCVVGRRRGRGPYRSTTETLPISGTIRIRDSFGYEAVAPCDQQLRV